MASGKILIVEVVCADFNNKSIHNYYVKVSTHEDDQLETGKMSSKGKASNVVEKFVFGVPSNGANVSFKIYKEMPLIKMKTLIGVATLPLDFPEYDTDDDDVGSCYQTPLSIFTDDENKIVSDNESEDSINAQSLDILNGGISKGKLSVETKLGKLCIVGESKLEHFAMRYQDYMMEKTNKGPKLLPMCFKP